MPKTCKADNCSFNVFGGGYCIRHQYFINDKKPKAIRKTVLKPIIDKEAITANKSYYAKAIFANIERNKGKCRCDECGREIKTPTGRNVCHIIGKGANTALYHDIRNHLILGKGEIHDECNCGWLFDESGRWHEMKVAEHVKQIKEQLNKEYYQS